MARETNPSNRQLFNPEAPEVVAYGCMKQADEVAQYVPPCGIDAERHAHLTGHDLEAGNGRDTHICVEQFNFSSVAEIHLQKIRQSPECRHQGRLYFPRGAGICRRRCVQRLRPKVHTWLLLFRVWWEHISTRMCCRPVRRVPFQFELKYKSTSRVPKYILVTASASMYGDFFTGGG